jgi:putative spermidine/putrescine transport system permease protein
MAVAHRLGTLAAWGGLALVFLAPIGVFILHAFSVRWFYPQVVPHEWALAPFLKHINQSRTQEALLESLSIALLVSGLSVLVAYPAARTLGLGAIRGKGVVSLLLFFPTVVPPVATGMGLNILCLKIGLAGTMVGVVLVHLIPILPYTVFALAGVFARYDPNYEYQARVLGAGRVRVFLTITLPLVLPGVVVAALFAFLISWSEYLLTFLIGGGRVITMPVLLFSSVAGGNPTTIAVLALLFVAPPVVVIIATARYLMRYGVPGQTDHG